MNSTSLLVLVLIIGICSCHPIFEQLFRSKANLMANALNNPLNIIPTASKVDLKDEPVACLLPKAFAYQLYAFRSTLTDGENPSRYVNATLKIQYLVEQPTQRAKQTVRMTGVDNFGKLYNMNMTYLILPSQSGNGNTLYSFNDTCWACSASDPIPQQVIGGTHEFDHHIGFESKIEADFYTHGKTFNSTGQYTETKLNIVTTQKDVDGECMPLSITANVWQSVGTAQGRKFIFVSESGNMYSQKTKVPSPGIAFAIPPICKQVGCQ